MATTPCYFDTVLVLLCVTRWWVCDLQQTCTFEKAEFWKNLSVLCWGIHIHRIIVIFHSKLSMVLLLITSWYLHIYAFWLIEYQCHTVFMVICLELGWLIFDPHPSLFSHSLFFCLWHQRGRVGNEYQVAHWRCHRWPWLPDVLVRRCQQWDLSRGLVRVCRGGQTVRRRLQSEVLSLTRACHSYCLFLYSSLSVDCWS